MHWILQELLWKTLMEIHFYPKMWLPALFALSSNQPDSWGSRIPDSVFCLTDTRKRLVATTWSNSESLCFVLDKISNMERGMWLPPTHSLLQVWQSHSKIQQYEPTEDFSIGNKIQCTVWKANQPNSHAPLILPSWLSALNINWCAALWAWSYLSKVPPALFFWSPRSGGEVQLLFSLLEDRKAL